MTDTTQNRVTNTGRIFTSLQAIQVASFAAAYLSLAGCGSSARTQTIIEVRADSVVESDANEIRIEVRDATGAITLLTSINPQATDFSGFPLQFPINSRSDDDRVFEFRASAINNRRQGDGSVLVTTLAENRVRTGFRRGEVLRFTLWLLSGCRCDVESQRCEPDSNGDLVPECVAQNIDVTPADSGIDAASNRDGGSIDAPIVTADAEREVSVNVDTSIGLDSSVESGADARGGCDPGLTVCSGACVDLQSDTRFCGSCTRACGATQTCAAGSCQDRVTGLVLSEIRAQMPPFVELYNGGASPVDLAGYLLQWSADAAGSDAVTLPSQTLAPGEFVVIAGTARGLPASTIVVAGVPAWRERVAVRLLTPAGVGQDFVRTADSAVPPPVGTAWTGSGAPNPARDVNQSLVRRVYASDSDSAADWSLQTLSSPATFCARAGRCGANCVDLDNDGQNCGTCGVTCGENAICRNGACAPSSGHLWFSEYRRSARPMIELHNPTAFPIDLQGYRLQVDSGGSTRLNFPLPTRAIAPGGFLAVYAGNGTDDANSIFTGAANPFVPNAAFTLFDLPTHAVDFVPFGTATTTAPNGVSWFGGAVPDAPQYENASRRRNIAALDSDSAAEWIEAMPATPGFACVTGLLACGNLCVDTDVNPNHCGVCGRTCGANATCVQGTCRASGQVLLSRLKNQGTEEFEVYNGTTSPVDLSGWTVSWVDNSGIASFVVPQATTLMPNQYAVFFEGNGAGSTLRFAVGRAINWTTFISVALLNASGTGVDFVRTEVSATVAPAGTAWVGANASNPSDSLPESLVRNVWESDTDGAADWRIVANVSGPGLCGGSAVCGGTCANTRSDASNCGGCGNECLVGNRCYEGRCYDAGPHNWDARLVTGSETQGLLEVFLSGTWIRACDTTSIGATACRQLGFSSGSDMCCTPFGTGVSSSWFSNGGLQCDANDQTLAECSAGTIDRSCTASRNLGVTCR